MTGDERPTGPAEQPMSWNEFTRRLADGIERMAVESFLILALPSDDAGIRAYVQFVHWGNDDGSSAGLRAEAVGSSNMPATRPLTPAQEERLASLEWEGPTDDRGGRNFVREWPMPAPFVEVADLMTRTLRDVYGVADPTDLRFRYSSFERTAVEDLDLGLEAEERPAGPRSKPPMRPTAARLGPVVEDGLRRLLGVERLERDADGDYPIPVGSAVMFVRLIEGRPPMVGVFSPVLVGIDEGPGLFAALNDINRRIHYARAFWVARQVIIAVELPAVDITADQIAFACVQLGSLADHLDNVLHGRFGGAFTFEVAPTLLN